MKTYILSIPQQLKEKSAKLDASAVLCKAPYVVFNEDGVKQQFIFQKGGKLIISTNGDVVKSAWEYFPQAHSVMISSGDKDTLMTLAYADNNVIVLQKDGTEEYTALISNDVIKQFCSISAINTYLELQTPKTKSEIKKESEWICTHKNFGYLFFVNYLSKNPDGEHIQEAREYLDSIESELYAKIVSGYDRYKNTADVACFLDALYDYILCHPKGKSKSLIEPLLDCFLDDFWPKITRARINPLIPALYTKYLPSGKHVPELTREIGNADDYLWDAIKSSSNRKNLGKYSFLFTNGQHLSDIEQLKQFDSVHDSYDSDVTFVGMLLFVTSAFLVLPFVTSIVDLWCLFLIILLGILMGGGFIGFIVVLSLRKRIIKKKIKRYNPELYEWAKEQGLVKNN